MLLREDLVRQLDDLGVERGGVLLVHTSFRAIRPIENGAAGLIEGLRAALGPEGTLVMPSWAGSRTVFDPRRSPASPDLGVVADVFWRLPGVLRSDHAHAFAAVGPYAAEVLRDPLPLPPHVPESPVGRVHDLDGQILLLGVNHDANTTIHLGELMSAVPYGVTKYVTVVREGRPARLQYRENDHCCQRFQLVDEWLRAAGSQTEGPVGQGVARLTRSRAVTAVVMRELGRDLLAFLHPEGQGCEECDAARASTVPA